MLVDENVEFEIFVLSSVVGLEVLDLSVFLIFNEGFVFFECIEHFVFVSQKTYLALFRMVNKTDEVPSSFVRFDAHRATFVRVDNF